MNKSGKGLITGLTAFSLVLSSTVASVMAESPVTSLLQTKRLWGADRYETAVKISQAGWKTSDNVVLATGEDFADALSAAPLAKKLNAPILLTESSKLNAETEKEIKRLNAKHVVIVGLNGAVSAAAEAELKALGISIERIGGQDRYDTSTLIAEKLDTSSKVVLASGEKFPDALSIAPIAASEEMPILLVKQNELPKQVSNYITQNKSKITKTYVIGQTAAVSQAVADAADKNAVRLGGADRFETNAEVLKNFAEELNYKNIYVAVGDGTQGNEFADALAGSALAVKTSSPVVLVYKDLNTKTKAEIQNQIAPKKNVIALGGAAVLPDEVVDQVNSLKLDAVAYTTDGETKTAGDVTKDNVSVDAKNVTLKDANVAGNVYIYGDGAKLSNVKVAGTVFVDPGENGSVTLENVQADKIRVRSGAQNSIHLIDVTADKLLVESDNAESSVRIVSTGTTSINNTVVTSYAIMDSEGGNLGTITISTNGAGDKTVELKGTFTAPVVVSGGAQVNVAAGTTVKTIQVVGSAQIAADASANVQNVVVATLGNETVALAGKIANVELKSAARIEVAANAVIASIIVDKEAKGAVIDVPKGATISSVTGDGASSVSVIGEGAGNVTIGETPIIIGGGNVGATTDNIQDLVNAVVGNLNSHPTVTNNLTISEMSNKQMTVKIQNNNYSKLADIFNALKNKSDADLTTRLGNIETLLSLSEFANTEVAGLSPKQYVETKFATYFTGDNFNDPAIIQRFKAYTSYSEFIDSVKNKFFGADKTALPSTITIYNKTLTKLEKVNGNARTLLYDSSKSKETNWNTLSTYTDVNTSISDIKGNYVVTIGGTEYTIAVQ